MQLPAPRRLQPCPTRACPTALARPRRSPHPPLFPQLLSHLPRRYKYMHGSDGDYHNPFDKGWRRNCLETCKPLAAPPAPFVLRCALALGARRLQDPGAPGRGLACFKCCSPAAARGLL